MKLNQRVLLFLSIALSLSGSYAQAWDIDSLKTWMKRWAATDTAPEQEKPKHRKPQQTVFGPRTYFVGEQGTDSFGANANSNYKLKVRASGNVKVDYILNGKKHHLVISNKRDRHRQSIQLNDQNTLQILKVSGKAKDSVTFRISTRDLDLPPDPVVTAPALNPASAPDVAASTAFIYSGANPLQTGVASGTIDSLRVGVLRGRVLDEESEPLAGVVVTALGHIEYGQTLTREDGLFDFAVNGGEEITLNFKKDGYLSSNRPFKVLLRDFTPLDKDVILIERDSKVSQVAFGSNASQVATASPVVDQDGQRTAVLFVPPSTGASLKFANGQTRAVTSLNIRATEITVGEDGPKKMPAPLSANADYTYAVSFAADEAEAAGASSVVFSKPIYHYVDNFLNLPVGSIVPNGFLDETTGKWVSSLNGRVLKLMTVSNGRAVLDVDGAGSAASSARLQQLSITSEELRSIANLYSSGKTFWRSPVPHFSTLDSNLATNASNVDQAQLVASAPQDLCNECAKRVQGSIIDVENQTLGESVPIAGTAYSLNYTSTRATERIESYSLKIPITGPNVPATLSQVLLNVSVAGQTKFFKFPATPNQVFEFVWDGKDAYGRKVSGSQIAFVILGYEYGGASYVQPLEYENSFDSPNYTSYPTPIAPRVLPATHLSYSLPIGILDARANSLGGWTLNIHHAYDPVSKTLYFGSGTSRSASQIGSSLSTIWFGAGGSLGDVLPLANGALLIADGVSVKELTTSGAVRYFAGGGVNYTGGNIATSQMGFRYISALAKAGNGTVYIGDSNSRVIRSVSPARVVKVVGGNGSIAPSYAPTLATTLNLGAISHVAVADDGVVFTASSDRSGVVRIGLDGYGVVVQGTEDLVPAGQFVPAVEVSRDGRSLFILPSGREPILLSAGQTKPIIERGYAAGEYTVDLGVDENESVYVSSSFGKLYKIVENEAVEILLSSNLSQVGSISIGADQSIYIIETEWLRKVTDSYPAYSGQTFSIPSADASEIYDFDKLGRHLSTRNALTNTPLHTFEYDAEGKLLSVVDRDDNRTLIHRDSSGRPVAIVSPFGVESSLSSNQDGYLASITDPAGGSHSFSYVSGTGLLSRFITPNGSQSTFTYDSRGRLASDTDGAGATQSLERIQEGLRNHVVRYTSATGVQSTYGLNFTIYRNKNFTSSNPDGSSSQTSGVWGGFNHVVDETRTTYTTIHNPDPRFGYASTYKANTDIRTPQGLLSRLSVSKSVVNGQPEANGNVPFILTETSSLNGKNTVKRFDSSARTWTRTSPMGRVSKTELDEKGRIKRSILPGIFPIDLNYDARGRLSTQVQGDRSTSYGYDSRGYLSSVTNALNQTTTFDNDLLGRTRSQTLPDGRSISMSYDANGNMTSITPPGKPASYFTFDPRNMMSTSVLSSEAATTSYTYTPDRKPATVTRPNGNVVSYNYNSTSGQLVSLSSPTHWLGYAYSGTGQVENLSRVNAGSSAEQGLYFAYDGPLLHIVHAYGEVPWYAVYSYDNNLQPKRKLAVIGGPSMPPAGLQVEHEYDDDGFLIGYFIPEVNYRVSFLSRDPASGKLTKAKYYLEYDDTFSYNSFGEIISYSGLRPDLNIEYTYNITRDKLGRIQSKSESLLGNSISHDFEYDLSGRLTRATVTGRPTNLYSYDSNGNRLTKTSGTAVTTSTYNDKDQLLTSGGYEYTYTANGERRTKTMTATGASTSYRYDSFGNLTGVTLPDGKTIDYVLDGLNRRVGKKINGALVEGYAYFDDNRLAARFDLQQPFEVQAYAYTENRLTPEVAIDYSSSLDEDRSFRIYIDEKGTPNTIVNNTQRQITQKLEIDEFGVVLSDTNPGHFPFGLAGCLYDIDTKLCHFGARAYDPEVGRWLQRDPILFDGGDTNLMGYVANDPVNKIDPSGLADFCSEQGDGPYKHQFVCYKENGKDVCKGLYPDPQNTSLSTLFGGKGTIGSDSKKSASCNNVDDGKGCMDDCIKNATSQAAPKYAFVGIGGTNCQQYARNIVASCQASCGGK